MALDYCCCLSFPTPIIAMVWYVVSVIIVNICDTLTIGGDAGNGCKTDVKHNGSTAANSLVQEVRNAFLFVFL